MLIKKNYGESRQLMVTIGILIFLLLGIYTGARRGLALQIIHFVGYIISIFIAIFGYRAFSKMIEMYVPFPSYIPGTHLAIFSDGQALEMDQSFYYLFSFIIIMVVNWAIVRLITTVIKEMVKLPIIKQFNTLGGAILGFVFHYVAIFFVLYLVAMIPTDSVQKIFEGHTLANWIVTHTPLFSGIVKMWLFS